MSDKISIDESDGLSRGSVPFLFLLSRKAAVACACYGPDGEAKFWLEPQIELAQNYGLKARDVKAAMRLIEEHENEIREAWNTYFRSRGH